MYKVYILKSEKTGRSYSGSTEDLENRMAEHNSGETKSIKSGIPWRVIHVEEFETRAGAIAKEKAIKSRGAARYLRDFQKRKAG